MIEKAKRIVRIMLGDQASVNREQIEECVNEVLSMEKYKDCKKDVLIREIESLYNISVEDFRIIEAADRRRPWLNEKRIAINWNFWSRYRLYLHDEKNYPSDTLNKLDRLTDRILDDLFDPTANIQVDKKGLVVGQVQSGKTSNYTGLICKAADAGFKLIIVLAGIHNNLRSQTQLRIDEGVLGFDTQFARAFNLNNAKLGVGKINLEGVAQSLTSSLDNGDSQIGESGTNFETREPIIAVVKKNPQVLRRLHQWLSSKVTADANGNRVISRKALLLIDDEADNASINTNRADWEPTRINGQIRDLLSLFRKSAYVGYTATPFANLFIRPKDNDLFPRDFIVNIPAPSNYVGPEKIFGFRVIEEDQEDQRMVYPIVNRIEDYNTFVPDKHKQGDRLPSTIPDSLKLAIRCFILTCAIRRLRGQTTVHNSMLIHVSRFTNWQNHITGLVQEEFDEYRIGIDQNDPEILIEFRNTLETDHPGYKCYKTVSSQILDSPLATSDSQIGVHKWEEVLVHLNEAVSRISVKAINGGSRDALNYFDHKDGLSVIAIGGNKLSRGLTLEGLSVSYFLRASKMYDTLMQMGRWFGYRPGYVDICRLFTSRELNEWFCHITHATEELREEFDYMSDVAGSTPEQYALKVLTHPGALQISAANKLRTAVELSLSWAGRLVESYELNKDSASINNNFEETKAFVSKLANNYNDLNNAFLWYDVSVYNIIDYLGRLNTPENLKAYAPQSLIRFINAQQANDELTSWRVALMSKKNSTKVCTLSNDFAHQIGCFKRTQSSENSSEQLYYLRNSRLISPKNEFIDLTEDEYERAMTRTIIDWERRAKEGVPDYPSGEIVRNEIRNPMNPLLLIYLLDPAGAELSEGSNPFVAYAISFPGSRHHANVTYAVNEELLDRFNIEENSDDYDDYDDEN